MLPVSTVDYPSNRWASFYSQYAGCTIAFRMLVKDQKVRSLLMLFFTHDSYTKHISAIIEASVRPSVCHTLALYQNSDT